MFRRAPPETNYARCFPRIRGDVPPGDNRTWLPHWFSPHTRGCSGWYSPGAIPGQVFPAYAGMFRRPLWRRKYCRSFPRIRGDVPPSALASLNASSFSPHTRGCSGAGRLPSRRTIVFPAYAGMFRRRHRDHTGGGGFPRIRGDVPLSRTASYTALMFSPHTRGCSVFFAGLHQLS